MDTITLDVFRDEKRLNSALVAQPATQLVATRRQSKGQLSDLSSIG